MLYHPRIVLVYVSGLTADGRWYFSSQFIDGSDLGRIMHAGRLPVTEAVGLVLAVADAVGHAHI